MIKRILLSEYLIALFCVLYFLAMIPWIRGWTSAPSLNNMLSATLPLLVIAIGQMFVLITAGIDLSVVAVIAMASVFGASFMGRESGYLAGSPMAVPVAISMMLLVGLLIGLINGISVALWRMPAFMVTLATKIFFVGLAIWYTPWHFSHFSESGLSSSSIAGLPSTFNNLWKGTPVPHTFWIVLVIAIGAHLILSHTVFGRSLYAVGTNRLAAKVSGIRVPRTIISAYLLCGMLAAVGAILYTSQLRTGTPIMGEGKLLDVIGATVIGGTSLFGGKGKVTWTFFGVLFLVLIDNSLMMMGMSPEIVTVCKGAVILMAAVLDALRNRILV